MSGLRNQPVDRRYLRDDEQVFSGGKRQLALKRAQARRGYIAYQANGPKRTTLLRASVSRTQVTLLMVSAHSSCVFKRSQQTWHVADHLDQKKWIYLALIKKNIKKDPAIAGFFISCYIRSCTLHRL